MADAIVYDECLKGHSVEFTSTRNERPKNYSHYLPGTNYHNGYVGVYESRPATRHSKRSPSGWRPPMSWYHYIYRVEAPMASLYHSDKWGNNHRYTATLNGPLSVFAFNNPPALPSLGHMVDDAVNQALSNLSNQKVDLGQNFAERQQLTNSIGGHVKGIAHEIGKYKRDYPRDWPKVKKLNFFGVKKLGAIPNSWLELQFGIKPLMSDIKGSFDFMKEIDKENDTFRITAKGGGHSSNSYPWKRGNVDALNGLLNVYVDLRSNQEVGAFCRLDYAMVNPALHQLQQVGLANPAALAWNLLPYSFVLDWVLPVGDYLSSWTAALGLSFLGGSISTFQRRVDVVTGFHRLPGHTTDTLGSIEPGLCSRTKFNRTVLTSSPYPRLPHFRNPLSLTHFADAMSLLVNVLR